MRLDELLKDLDETLEAIEANTSDSTMRLARSGRDIIDEILEEQLKKEAYGIQNNKRTLSEHD